MRIYLLRSIDELARYADEWDKLSRGVPFRSWAWLSSWWQAYGNGHDASGPHRTLAVPCVFDESEQIVGLGPWYLERTATGGRTLRMLGDGEACSDYLSILCAAGREEFVAHALADFLSEPAGGDDASAWDLMELTGIDAEDVPVRLFVGEMIARGHKAHERPGMNCWRIELPTNEEAYLATLSRNRRQQLRRLDRMYLLSGRAKVCVVEQSDQLPAAMEMFVGMLQRRRQSLGEPGSFSSPAFRAFYQTALPALFREGRAQLAWLEVDGRPVAADYLVNGNGIVYAYQGTIEPDALELEPGKTIYLALLRQAIAQGYRGFDFLRGDEPYKAHFRAAPRPSVEWRLVPPRSGPRLRHNLWLAGTNVKQWLKTPLSYLWSK